MMIAGRRRAVRRFMNLSREDIARDQLVLIPTGSTV